MASEWQARASNTVTSDARTGVLANIQQGVGSKWSRGFVPDLPPCFLPLLDHAYLLPLLSLLTFLPSLLPHSLSTPLSQALVYRGTPPRPPALEVHTLANLTPD